MKRQTRALPTTRRRRTLAWRLFSIARPPAGAVADKGGGSKAYTATDSTNSRQAVILLIVSPQQQNLNFRGTFDAVAKQMTASGKMIDPGNAVTTKSRQGYDAISQNFITEMAGGERVYVRLVAVNVDNRLATFCFLASGGVLYTKHTPDMDNLLQSVRFDAGAANPERPIAPAPMPAPAPAAPATGIPANQEDAALAKAIEAFNAGKDARRKPHTVLGTIFTLDGRADSQYRQLQRADFRIYHRRRAAQLFHGARQKRALRTADSRWPLSRVCYLRRFSWGTKRADRHHANRRQGNTRQ